MSLDNVREHFPAIYQEVNDSPLVYLDSAASTLKCKPSIDRLYDFYLNESANVHRGAHTLSDRATTNFEKARKTVKEFLNASSTNEIVFTSGTTESINLVAACMQIQLKPGDEILITEMEHHSNIVPWQVACEKSGAQLKFIKITEMGMLDLNSFEQELSEKTKLLSLTVISNALGVINPVKEIIKKAKQFNTLVMLDAAQSVAVMKTDVQDLGCDFLAFSGHKVFGPHGIGVLYGKEEILNSFPPYKTGGSMIDSVTMQKSTYLNSPQRFEAGTPHIAGAIGLAKALEFIKNIGFEQISAHETELMDFVDSELRQMNGVKVFGPLNKRANICSLNVEGAHPTDIGHLLDQQGIAIRTGHHCCQPLMQALGVTGTVRASFSIYNTLDDAKAFIAAIKKCKEFL